MKEQAAHSGMVNQEKESALRQVFSMWEGHINEEGVESPPVNIEVC